VKALLACALALALTGCVASNPASPPTPASPQSLDLTFARTLLDAQTAIQTAAGLVPTTPSLKAPLNTVIASYNVAESAYLAYHQAVTAGGAPDATALTAQITNLTNSVAALVTLFGGSK
jgi:hypothetical protein